MPWARFDDHFPDHPKVAQAGPLASWLNVCAICYCSRYLTDGFVPMGQVRKLADVDNAFELADQLVAVGLWERFEDGFRVHDYLEYNPTREKVLAEREAAKQRMNSRRSGDVRENNERTELEPDENLIGPVPVPVPVPVPNPKPEEETASAPSAPPAKRKRPEFSHDSEEYRLSRLLATRIRENNPKAKAPTEAILQRWSNTARLMVEQDGRTYEEIRENLLWSQQHEFWFAVILSMDNLRAKFDQITTQRIREERNDGTTRSPNGTRPAHLGSGGDPASQIAGDESGTSGYRSGRFGHLVRPA